MDIRSVCMSVGSSKVDRVSPSATLSHDDGERHWQITMEWADLPLIKSAEDNPAEWLYAVLWSLMTDFDDHLVTSVTVGPSMRAER